MEIRLYASQFEKNKVVKNVRNMIRGTFNGTLRERCSIIEPVITLNATEEIPMYRILESNYAYIPEFNRYYFITDMEVVNNNLVTVYMRVDVLNSFSDEIKNLSVMVSRQEYIYDNSLLDDKVPIGPGKFIKYLYPKDDKGSDTTFSLFNAASDNSQPHCFVLSVYSGEQTYSEPPENFSPTDNKNSDLNNLTVSSRLAMSPYTSMSACYAMTYKQLVDFAKELSSFDIGATYFGSKGDYVLDCKLYPMDIIQGNMIDVPIIINGREMKTEGRAMFNSNIGTSYNNNVGSFLSAFAFQIRGYYHDTDYTFLDYAPFSDWKLWLPYYGYVDIDPKYFLGGNTQGEREWLWVELCIDYSTGQATYRLSVGNSPSSANTGKANREQLEIIQFQLGVNVPINANNKAEWLNNKIISGIKAGIDVASFTATAGMKENLNTLLYSNRRGKIGKRAQQKAKLRSNIDLIEESGALSNNLVDTFAQSLEFKPISGNSTGFDMFSNCDFAYIQQIYSPVRYLLVENYSKAFAEIYGRPCKRYLKLGDLTGFTQCEDFHLEKFPNSLESELDEIDSLLREGVIL